MRLDTLRSIVQSVNDAPDLRAALQIIVQRVCQAVGSDVCSVYLTDLTTREHVLQATEGLRPESVGKVRLPLYRGLVGLVAERAEPLNLDNATGHPRYLRVSETGETHYRGFLGVPIIQHRRVLGVLVVRQERQRRFQEDEETFLLTLAAQLAGPIEHAQTSGELSALQAANRQMRSLHGLASAPGLAIGSAVVVYPEADLESVPDRPAVSPVDECARFDQAVRLAKGEIAETKRLMQDRIPVEEQALFDAWQLMIESESLVANVKERIQGGLWAPSALKYTIREHAAVFETMEDEYLRQRAHDIRDLGERLNFHLQPSAQDRQDYSYPEQTILVGNMISALQMASVPRDRLRAVISATGSAFSHVAILARSLGVASVMGIADLPVGRLEGQQLIVDGYRGRVYVAPNEQVRGEYAALIEEERALAASIEDLRQTPAETLDGRSISLFLNTGLDMELPDQASDEASGVGLFRTELPFMVRDRFPSEEEQYVIYRKLLSIHYPKPVSMRTLDVGGDKPLPYFPLREVNPFLGWRGIRISLDHPEVFLTQIRAMLRASQGYGNLRILLPMISGVEEVDDALLLVHRAFDEISEEYDAIDQPKVGVMIEVPSAVYLVDDIARRVDFLSIGSNDLTQYLLAVDRNNSDVAGLYDELHPAVLRAIMLIVQGAARFGREVTICGEMAANPLAIPLLVGLGVRSFSMNAGALLRAKWVIRSFSLSQAKSLLAVALRCDNARSIRHFCVQALEDLGLGGLVRPGR